jgi:hypothetical protein
MNDHLRAARRAQSRPIVSPTGIFLVSHVVPAFSYVFLSLTRIPFNVLAIVTLLFSVGNFFIVKNISGYQMLGLKWAYDCRSLGIAVSSRPEPFVPVLGQSNFFWMGIFVFNAFWVVCFFVSLAGPLSKSAISGVAFLLELANLVCFAKAHRESKQRTGQAVLSSMRDGIHFEEVPEGAGAPPRQPPKPALEKVAATSIELPPPLTGGDGSDDGIF